MDQERFDQLARGLTSGITRRGMVRNLMGAALGGVLVAEGVSEVGARKRKKKRGGKRKRRQTQCATCSDTCTGAAENNPTKTLSFTPTGDLNYCTVIVNLAGFAGCTSFTAEYWSKAVGNFGNVILGPTDLSGSSQTTLGSYAKGGELDIRINGVVTDWTPVSC
jgi:hypothetical protein